MQHLVDSDTTLATEFLQAVPGHELKIGDFDGQTAQVTGRGRVVLIHIQGNSMSEKAGLAQRERISEDQDKVYGWRGGTP